MDIRCNKGFFTYYYSKNFNDVVGIEPDEKYLGIHTYLFKSNISILNCSFRDFVSTSTFDRIFIGNGPHHLFNEINGHEWIAKLAALSTDLVLTEGSVDNTTQDFLGYPNSYNTFFSDMCKYFECVLSVPSVSYTPGCSITLWKRLPFIKTDSSVCIIEKKFRCTSYINNNRVSVFIASTSPISNGLIGFTKNGWTELFSNKIPFRYFENERELFSLHCQHQRYLYKLGYWDLDPATINFFRDSNKLFDKSDVMPISNITQYHIEGYKKLFLQSYNTISIEEALNESIPK